ncbi:hypothetical protein C8R43DRAFT_957635 [Mycena crocata]|nr:hypothetical protein C8R43DRAFT_957635 [Mycena crocata]
MPFHPGATVTDPIFIDPDLINVLDSYLTARVDDVSCITTNFLNTFLNDSPFLESCEVDNFILRNGRMLAQWLLAVSRLFRIISDLTSPAFNIKGRQWRSSIIEVFYRYFFALWADEKILSGMARMRSSTPSQRMNLTKRTTTSAPPAHLPMASRSILSIFKRASLAKTLGFADVTVIPSAHGQNFNVQFQDAQNIPDASLPCVNELLAVLDAPHVMSLEPPGVDRSRCVNLSRGLYTRRRFSQLFLHRIFTIAPNFDFAEHGVYKAMACLYRLYLVAKLIILQSHNIQDALVAQAKAFIENTVSNNGFIMQLFKRRLDRNVFLVLKEVADANARLSLAPAESLRDIKETYSYETHSLEPPITISFKASGPSSGLRDCSHYTQSVVATLWPVGQQLTALTRRALDLAGEDIFIEPAPLQLISAIPIQHNKANSRVGLFKVSYPPHASLENAHLALYGHRDSTSPQWQHGVPCNHASQYLFMGLVDCAVYNLQHHMWTEVQMDNDFHASLVVGKLILPATSYGRMSEMAESAVNLESATTDISHAYVAIELWLLLAQRKSFTKNRDRFAVGGNTESAAFVGCQDSSMGKLSPALKILSEPPSDPGVDVLVNQTIKDVVAAEKVRVVEAKRDASRASQGH